MTTDASPASNSTVEPVSQGVELDAIIVGAGFSGVYILHKLRDELKLHVKIFESGAGLGGTWYWNRYPGARVDSPVPVYELSVKKVWESWNWSEKYPGWKELQAYFDHVDRVLNIKKDVYFNTRVDGAQFDLARGRWTVRTENGKTVTAKYLIVSVGFSAKRYIPDWKGLDTFKGVIHHSSFWPEQGVDVRGKKVAVIGTGATGVQIIQEWGKEAGEVTVFQRNPNFCLPMRQTQLSASDQDKSTYDDYYAYRLSTFGGLPWEFVPQKTFDVSEEERVAFYEKCFQEGGFQFWLGSYQDLLFDPKANRVAYDYWAKKTRARVEDPIKRDLLAPLEPPYHFGTKRASLEQDYYEQFNRPNVHVVSVKDNPIVEITPNAIVTADGRSYEVDVIAIATGFDAITGGIKNMGLKDIHGVDLAKKWDKGTYTYLGATTAGFPNMFFTYGPQAPTAFSNGPTCAEVQGDFIAGAIQKMQRDGIKYIDPQAEAERAWHDEVQQLANQTLVPQTKSWYMGSNIPGKPVESLNYLGGIPVYQKKLKDALDKDFDGFVTAAA